MPPDTPYSLCIGRDGVFATDSTDFAPVWQPPLGEGDDRLGSYEPTDSQLLAKIADGDRQAFTDFYDRYSARTYGLILKILRNKNDADEVLQETFWQIWKKAGAYDVNRAYPRAWLFLIARSRAIDHLRRQPPSSTTEQTATLIDHESQSPTERVETVEYSSRIRTALEKLPREQAVSIEMAFYGGLTHVQLAQRLSIPVGTVKTRIRSGMSKLRTALQEVSP